MTPTLWPILFWIALVVLAYVHIGYFLLLFVLGSRRRPLGDTMAELPRVSLIIPAHNEEKVLTAKLENALALDYPDDRLEILVASDGSSDRTNDMASAATNRGVKLLAFAERRGKASVLNDAVQSASGTILCLCDANVMFHPDALRHLVMRLADQRVGAVTGDVRLASHEANFGQGESFYYMIEKRLQEAESNLGSLMGVDGGMYVLRRELFRPLPPDTILDDFVLSMQVIRQGHRVAYEPRAIAEESGTPLARQEYRRRVRVSAGAVQSLKRRQWPPIARPIEVWQYVSHKLLRWLGPLWLVLLMVASIALWRSGWIYQVAVIAQGAVLLLAMAGTVLLPIRATRLGGVAFYFVLSHVAMVVGTLKGLFNRQRVTWAQADRGRSADHRLADNRHSHAAN